MAENMRINKNEIDYYSPDWESGQTINLYFKIALNILFTYTEINHKYKQFIYAIISANIEMSQAPIESYLDYSKLKLEKFETIWSFIIKKMATYLKDDKHFIFLQNYYQNMRDKFTDDADLDNFIVLRHFFQKIEPELDFDGPKYELFRQTLSKIAECLLFVSTSSETTQDIETIIETIFTQNLGLEENLQKLLNDIPFLNNSRYLHGSLYFRNNQNIKVPARAVTKPTTIKYSSGTLGFRKSYTSAFERQDISAKEQTDQISEELSVQSKEEIQETPNDSSQQNTQSILLQNHYNTSQDSSLNILGEVDITIIAEKQNANDTTASDKLNPENEPIEHFSNLKQFKDTLKDINDIHNIGVKTFYDKFIDMHVLVIAPNTSEKITIDFRELFPIIKQHIDEIQSCIEKINLESTNNTDHQNTASFEQYNLLIKEIQKTTLRIQNKYESEIKTKDGLSLTSINLYWRYCQDINLTISKYNKAQPKLNDLIGDSTTERKVSKIFLVKVYCLCIAVHTIAELMKTVKKNTATGAVIGTVDLESEKQTQAQNIKSYFQKLSPFIDGCILTPLQNKKLTQQLAAAVSSLTSIIEFKSLSENARIDKITKLLKDLEGIAHNYSKKYSRENNVYRSK